MAINKLERKMNFIEWIMLALSIIIADGLAVSFVWSYTLIVTDIVNVVSTLAIVLVDLLILWLFLDNKR